MSHYKPIVDKWVSVNDKLPAINIYILIKTQNCRYKAIVGYYNGTEWRSCEKELLTCNVEYWAELNID